MLAGAARCSWLEGNDNSALVTLHLVVEKKRCVLAQNANASDANALDANTLDANTLDANT
jgi:hypothetical protein